MNAPMVRGRKSAGRYLPVGFFLLLLAAGCDLGMEDSSNRYEQLNQETKKLIAALRPVTDEASANTQLSAVQDAADKIRAIQKRVREAAEKRAEKGGGGMGVVANFRQASLFQQSGDSARRQIDRIRENNEKAGAIIDKAVEGIEFPPPPQEFGE